MRRFWRETRLFRDETLLPTTTNNKNQRMSSNAAPTSIEKANKEKEKGNEAFKKGNWGQYLKRESMINDYIDKLRS